jgi:hypothetical protein
MDVLEIAATLRLDLALSLIFVFYLNVHFLVLIIGRVVVYSLFLSEKFHQLLTQYPFSFCDNINDFFVYVRESVCSLSQP